MPRVAKSFKKTGWSLFFSTRLTDQQQIDLPLEQAAWQGKLGGIKLVSLLCWSQAILTYRAAHWHRTMLLELFHMLEVCCGSGASSRAMITYMCRIGREGKGLLIDIMTLDVLLLTYPELKPYLELRWLDRLFRGVLNANEAGRFAATG